MNTILRPLLALSLLCTLNPQLSSAQGSLTPPAGAPAAAMKTLDQIEARKPVQSLAAAAPYTISQPGSYYLTGNITVATGDAIVITSDDVSLDLNGFTIRSTFTGGGNGTAISVSGDRSRLTVRHGSIVSATTVPTSGLAVGAGFFRGIYSGSTITQVLVSEVHVMGVSGAGIYLDAQGVVDRCTVRNCGGAVITASVVQNSNVENCLGTGISADGNALNCTAFGRDGRGLSADNATNCTGTSTNGTGLYTSRNATNCSGSSQTGTGLYCGANASNSFGSSGPGSAGISVSGTASFCRGSRPGGVGIQAANAIGCTVSNGTVNASLKSLGTP